MVSQGLSMLKKNIMQLCLKELNLMVQLHNKYRPISYYVNACYTKVNKRKNKMLK